MNDRNMWGIFSDTSSKKSLAVIASFVLAFVLWLVVTLQGNYQVVVSMPLRITGIPNEMDLYHPDPPMLHLNIGAEGLEVMGKWLNPRKDTIRIPYQQVFATGYLLPRNQLLSVRNTLRPIQLLEVVGPDTLFFEVEKKSTKKVPLYSQVELNLKSGFLMENPPGLTPDSVQLAGPAHVLDTIYEWYTAAIQTPRIAEAQTLDIPVMDTAKQVSVFPKETKMTVSPEPYTQTQLNIRIEIFDIPENTDVRLVDETVSVACLVPVHEYESIVAQSFTYRLSFSSLIQEGPFIIPKFTFLPKYVKILNANPDRITYVIVKHQPLASRYNGWNR